MGTGLFAGRRFVSQLVALRGSFLAVGFIGFGGVVCGRVWRLGTPGLRAARFGTRVSLWVVRCVG
jgi:hypothetical protein